MNNTIQQTMKPILFATVILFSMSACVSSKKFNTMQDTMKKDLALANKQLGECGEELSDYLNKLSACEQEKAELLSEINTFEKTEAVRNEQISGMQAQIEDYKSQRDKQMDQVGDLTVLSKSANDNIKETLAQMEKKDAYIHLLNAAKDKADSINLALAVNLKTVLQDGILDSDIEVKVDKTVVFINLSDKMLYQSGSSMITPKAQEVLGKIAKILEGRDDLEVMVEGYTDNIPIKNDCMQDNWDLSVKRATSVIRMLQNRFGVNPNKLIAAGRGEYNTLTSNDTYEGRQMNRRTRVIILPKIDQFYDLLDPNSADNNQ